MWGRRAKTVAEVDRFIDLLMVACEDSSVHATLDKILTLPDERRAAVIQSLLADMRKADAPKDFMAAIACLADTAVAEKAYEVIFNCRK
jgi:hypothetical protein